MSEKYGGDIFTIEATKPDFYEYGTYNGFLTNINGQQIAFYADSPHTHGVILDRLIKMNNLLQKYTAEMKKIKTRLAVDKKTETACESIQNWSHQNSEQAQYDVSVASKNLQLCVETVQTNLEKELYPSL